MAVPAQPLTLSVLFDRKGAILFQNEAALRHFCAPADNQRAVSAFVRHFVDRAEGRRLLAQVNAGRPVRLDARVHTGAGPGVHTVEISPASGPDGNVGIILIERLATIRDARAHNAELVRAFAQAGADWFWETDDALRITLMSDRPDLARTSLSADFIGRVIFVPHPGLEGLDYAAMRRAMERREMFRDLRFSRRDKAGRRRHFSVSGAPVFGADGAFQGYRGTGRDRTRSVEAEERAATAQARLEEKTALLRATLDSMHQGILVNDADVNVVMWNDRFLEMNGLPPAAIRAGMNAADLVRAAAANGEYGVGDVEEIAARRLAQMRDGAAGKVRLRPDGTVVEHHVNRMPGGMVLRTYTDITALKRRERDIEETGQLLRATLDNMDQGIMVLDAAGKVRMWNERLVEQYGLPPGFLRVGMPMVEVVAQVARQGELGDGDPAELAQARVDETSGEHGRIFFRRLRNGTVIERRRRDMPGGGSVLTHTDITALAAREGEIARQHALMAGTLANIDQGILVLDDEFKIVLWNARVLELLGVPPGFCQVGQSMTEIVAYLRRQQGLPPDQVAAAVAARIKDLTQDHVVTLSADNFGGRTIERRRRGLPGGGLVLTYTDITEAKRREQEIAEKSELLAATLENMDQGIMVMDADRKVRIWNSRMVEQHGLPKDFMTVGMQAAEIIHQLARQGEYGDVSPERAGRDRVNELQQDRSLVFQRRHSNGLMIERRRRPMPDGGTVLTYTDITALSDREHALENQGELLTATLANMDQGMLVLDADLNIRTWNERVIQLLNLPPDLVHLGRPVADIVRYIGQQGGRPSETLEERIAQRLADYRDGTPRVMPNLGHTGRIVERRSRPMPDGGVVLTYTDITALAERERALDEKSTHLTATLASMDQGMLVLSPDGKIQTWNQRIIELLELPPDFLRVGLPASDFVRMLTVRRGGEPDVIERDIATFIDEFRNGEARVFDGAELGGRVVERHSRPMPDGGLVVTYSDVTERKRREDVIAENSALLSATLDNMDQGLIVIDTQHRAKLWNNRLVEMFDLPPDVMRVGRPFAEILRYFIESAGTPPNQVELRLAERLIELTGEPVPLLDRHRPDGRVIERRRRIMPAGGSVITYGDVTARKRGEAALQRAKEEAEIASRSKTEFLANMSHELRTPLNAIIGFSDILVRQLFGPIGSERYNDYARDIHDSGQHLLNLINDVLDIAKIEVNKVELAEEPIDVAGAIEACVRLMRDRAVAAEVAIEVKMPAALPDLYADDRRLKQILLNLVSNAVKFTPPGGKVEIRVEHDAAGFRFIVADTGIGIAAGDLQTALTPFGQIDSSLSRRYDGTGLGLPLARSMAELHGGRLEIASEPGTGTTVTVTLPTSRGTRR
ncbi:MAG TPA: PAS-domain containing protein [Stellaceae bacterium]|nr:PAS-domain containing protein [Stellaceae bacterium]